jgi:hypothetical protein
MDGTGLEYISYTSFNVRDLARRVGIAETVTVVALGGTKGSSSSSRVVRS